MPLPDRPPPYETVAFDCDSTLSDMEGVEALAKEEHAEEVRRLTDAAMAGELRLEEAFGRRLDLVRPSRGELDDVGRAYVEKLLPNAALLIRALRSLEKRIVIVSGGLLPAVRRLATELGVDETFAVDVRFDADGRYADFDRASPLARAGGKGVVLEALARRGRTGGLALVGDGATDLEAAPVVDRFIAFGGVVRRAQVFERAVVGTSSRDFRDLVPLLLDPSEIETLGGTSEFHPLLPAAPA